MTNTITKYFKCEDGMMALINSYEDDGWFVKFMVPQIEGGYQSGSSTVGVYVVFQKNN